MEYPFFAPVTVLWAAVENLQLCEVDVEPNKYSSREEWVLMSYFDLGYRPCLLKGMFIASGMLESMPEK